jgi:hypothetical protein
VVERLLEREHPRYGREALAPGGRLFDEHHAFLDWVGAYDEGTKEGRSRPRHETWLARLPCPVLRLEGVWSVEEMVQRIIDYLEAIGRDAIGGAMVPGTK